MSRLRELSVKVLWLTRLTGWLINIYNVTYTLVNSRGYSYA